MQDAAHKLYDCHKIIKARLSSIQIPQAELERVHKQLQKQCNKWQKQVSEERQARQKEREGQGVVESIEKQTEEVVEEDDWAAPEWKSLSEVSDDEVEGGGQEEAVRRVEEKVERKVEERVEESGK